MHCEEVLHVWGEMMMPKTPDEIKKGLECCVMPVPRPCAKCPYHLMDKCLTNLLKDVFSLIQQLERDKAWAGETHDMLREENKRLEAQRDAAVDDLKTVKRCKVCKHDHVKDMVEPCFSCSCCFGVNNFEWRGVQKEE